MFGTLISFFFQIQRICLFTTKGRWVPSSLAADPAIPPDGDGEHTLEALKLTSAASSTGSLDMLLTEHAGPGWCPSSEDRYPACVSHEHSWIFRKGTCSYLAFSIHGTPSCSRFPRLVAFCKDTGLVETTKRAEDIAASTVG